MAIDATTARHQEWKCALTKLNELNQSLASCQPHERGALERAIADQEEDVLDTPAPSFSALLTKLELLFQGQLEGLNSEAEQRRLVIEDLSDLISETRELVGAQSPTLA
jgi:hypothetical protein